MRVQASGAAKFYTGGISVYPVSELYRETAFIAYYFHWPQQEIWELPHEDRRRFCEEISEMHERMSGTRPNNPFAV